MQLAQSSKFLQKSCDICEAIFDYHYSRINARFCSNKCRGQWLSNINFYPPPNRIAWNKGTKGLCKPNSGTFKKGQSISPSTQFKKGQTTGKNNVNWRGGITPINLKIRTSAEYKLWRKSVFDRDNYTCVFCGIRGGRLNADHIKPFAEFPDLRLSLDNGRTLCEPCHRNTPTYARKSNG